MKIEIGSWHKKKEEFDNKFIYCVIEGYNRDKFINRRILIRTLLILPLSFQMGYLLYYNLNSIQEMITYAITFVTTFITSFYICQIPFELIKCALYPGIFKSDEVKLKFFNRNRLLTAIYTESISTIRLLLSTLLPPIVIFIALYGFYKYNSYSVIFFGVITSCLVLSADYIVNLLLMLKRAEAPKKMNELSNIYD